VGVLALQGDFEKHLTALVKLGVEGREVRNAKDLAEVGRLIIPGGESTTVGLLLRRTTLGESIQNAVAEGMPIWGTCMGMIIMAREIVERPAQYTLKLLDVAVARNAFGAQVHSFEDSVYFEEVDASVLGVFIRAPIVKKCGPHVKTLATYNGEIVAVRQGRILGTAFHPELTEDTRVHEYFLQM
jgi:5'-phosphate synthase pdxT subunit